MLMNKKQKMQVAVGSVAAILIIFWLIMPGWSAAKILGMIANALVATSMAISYRAEEKKK